MATTTEKYGLTLPAGSDYVDIEVINENTRKIDAALAGKPDGVTLTHEKSGTVHALTGLGERSGILQAVFKATAGFTEGDTFTVDGTAYTALMPDGEGLSDSFFVSGAVVGCIIDTAALTVNFKGGGSGSLAQVLEEQAAIITELEAALENKAGLAPVVGLQVMTGSVELAALESTTVDCPGARYAVVGSKNNSMIIEPGEEYETDNGTYILARLDENSLYLQNPLPSMGSGADYYIFYESES